MSTYKMLGLMSGTSLDGLDLCYCYISNDEGNWTFDIAETKSVAYTSERKSKLKDGIHLKADELLEFHNEYGSWLGKEAKTFISEKKLEVDYIASHGHTTHHQPDKGFTFQIRSSVSTYRGSVVFQQL